jgi:hypothetical protein
MQYRFLHRCYFECLVLHCLGPALSKSIIASSCISSSSVVKHPASEEVMKHHLPFLFCILPGLVQSQYDEYQEDPNAIDGLPAGAAALLNGVYDDGFNCDQQDGGYGYYADVNNACKIFHICNPVYLNDGSLDHVDQYSFVCGEGTQFDQQTLTCNFPEDAFPCEESPSLYGVVEFGKIPEDY